MKLLSSLPARNLKLPFASLLFCCAAMFAPPDHAQSLNFYKNYFVTGDYTVAGVGLYGKGVNGIATGAINMSSVPAGADIIAAYLYWETVETTAAPSNFNGKFDGNAIVGASLGDKDEPACGVSGGTSPQVFTRAYRADVLRYLPIDSVNSIRLVDGPHTVTLTDNGGNVNAPHTYGASLVVIYRILKVGAAPLKAVVIYDGDYTMSKRSSAMFQFVSGFYQATGGANANMTQIVGDGQPGFNATLSVNGSPVSSSPFVGALGGRWDNYTFPIGNYVKANNFALETQTLSAGNQVCLSWAAVVTSMNVVNSDADGILDVWKSSGFINSLINIDPTGEPLPDLADMGAKHGQKDVFIQIDWMQGTDGHLHIPKLAALTMVANAFSAHGVKLHFDVGNNYQQTPPLPYIVPAKYAQGGSVIPESSLLCPNGKTSTCSFPEPYSVLSWKKGFLAVKNGFPVLNVSPHFEDSRKDIFHEIFMGHAMAGPFDAAGKPKTKDPSSVSGVADRPGGDLMITLGLWRTDNPANCVQSDPTGKNTNICTDQTGTVLVQAGTIMHELGHNLGLSHGGLFRVPNCMPDYPSVMNYLYQTRGLTDDLGFEHIDYSSGLLGPLDEKSLSETTSLGSSLYRIRFYGPPSALSSVAGQTTAKAHCDGTPLTGDLGVRLETPSHSSIPDWNNNGSVDAGPYAEDINFNGFKGDSVQDSVDPTKSAGDNSKRWFVDTNDWGNLNLQQVGARLNVNGLSVDVGQSDLGQSDLGQSDLGQSDLGQSDLGQSDLGQSDLGQSDLGQSDLGDVDYDTAISTLDATGSTTPLVATVSASTGTVFNQITLTWGPPSLGQIRTYKIYRTNLSATPLVTVLVGSVSGAPPVTTFNDMITDTAPWHSPASCPSTVMCYNANYQYFITAVDANGTTSAPSNFATGTVDHLFVTAYSGSVVYGNTLPNFSNTAATITGLPSGGITSSAFSCTNTTGSVPPRNVGAYTITCTGPAVGNPATVGVTYIIGTLTITQRPLTITAVTNTKLYDGTANASAIPLPSYGTSSSGLGLVNGDTVTSAETYDNRNAGTSKTLSVSAVIVMDGNNGGNYSPITNIPNSTGVISQRPLTFDAVTNTKTYDGTTSANAIPTIEAPTSTSGLVPGDGVTGVAETYDTRNAGSGKTLSVSAYTVNDGNSGNNYYPVTTKAVTTGVISQRALTIDAVTNLKTYDGTTSASANPIAAAATSTSGLVGGDTVTAVETYDTRNAGSGKTLSVSTYTVNDGNNGSNYYPVTTVMTNTGVISQRPLTIAAVTDTKTYDATTSSGATPVVVGPTSTSGLVLSDSVAGLSEIYTSPNAGSGTLSVLTFTVVDGNSGLNYNTALLTANGTINQRPLTVDAVTNTKTYDGTTSAAAVPIVEATTSTSGLVLNDTVTGLVETYASQNAGIEPLSVSAYTVNDGNSGHNYVVTLMTVNGTINPDPLTAFVHGTVQSGDTTTFMITSVAYSTFAGSDTAATAVTGTLSCSLGAPTGMPATYPISCLGLSASNYNISYDYSNSPGTVAAIPAPLMVNVNGTTKVVSETPIFTLTSFTYSGFVNGDSPSVVTGTLSCTAEGTADSSGNYPISCSGLSSTNYTITYSYSPGPGPISSSPAPLTVNVNGTQPVGGTPTYTVTYSGFLNGDTVSTVTGTLSCTTTATSTSSAGGYPISSCMGLSAPGTYTISYWLGTVNVM
jgi:hypothetical protein